MDPLVTGIRDRWKSHGLQGGPGPFMTISAVARLHQLLKKALDEELKQLDLGRTGYAVLTTLALIDSGEAQLSTLGRWLLVHPTTVKLTVDQLESAGLVTRSPHPSDRRATLVGITPQGRDRASAANLALDAPGGPLGNLAGAGHEELFAALQAARLAAGDLEAFGGYADGEPSGAAHA